MALRADDPMYLVGMYEAKLDALRAIFTEIGAAKGVFVDSCQIKLARAIIGLIEQPPPQATTEPEPLPPMPVPTNLEPF